MSLPNDISFRSTALVCCTSVTDGRTDRQTSALPLLSDNCHRKLLKITAISNLRPPLRTVLPPGEYKRLDTAAISRNNKESRIVNSYLESTNESGPPLKSKHFYGASQPLTNVTKILGQFLEKFN